MNESGNPIVDESYQSSSIKNIAVALNKAQATLQLATKDKTNPFFKSQYADLKSCWLACADVLTKNGLSVVQVNRPSPKGELFLVTQLMHISGEFIRGFITMPLTKSDPQGYGSAETYARRYGLCAMMGICPADDDGNAATFGKQATTKRTSGKKTTTKKTDTKEDNIDTSSSSTDDDF